MRSAIGVADRGRLYDIAAAAVRAGAAWVFAEHAMRALASGPGGPAGALAVFSSVELACAVLLAVGLGTPVPGLLLAGLALVVAPISMGPWHFPGGDALVPGDASPALLVLLAAACALPSLSPGRVALDHALRRRSARSVTPFTQGKPRHGDSAVRKPEEAPPLPYPEGRAVARRPSRT